MTENNNKTIVISAVNLVEGGGLSVLVDCLNSFAKSSYMPDCKVVALVHSKNIVPKLSGVEYIEIPKAKKNYLYRLYYEYVHFNRISRMLKPGLWLSLHDMSPRVKAEVQAVYMHNPTPFYSPTKLTWKIAPLTALWSYFYKYVYRINIHTNKYLVVQQQWLREEFSKMFSVPQEKIVVARPVFQKCDIKEVNAIKKSKEHPFVFLYPSYPRVFKNIEVICEAAKLLELENVKGYEAWLTIDGTENKYSNYLLEKYGDLKSVKFIGLRPKSEMDSLYSQSDCLIFSSKLETWGLPLSEYQAYNRPMLVANLPYAYESAEGGNYVCFFDPNNPTELAKYMKLTMMGNSEVFQSLPKKQMAKPFAESWEELFNILLNN